MLTAQGGCFQPKATFNSRGVIWPGAGSWGGRGWKGPWFGTGFGKGRHGLERWVGGQGRCKEHSLWSLAHLLIQAELREGQQQHQTKRGPTSQRQSGDRMEAGAGLATLPSPPAGSPHPDADSQKAEVTHHSPPPPRSPLPLSPAPPSPLLSLIPRDPAIPPPGELTPSYLPAHFSITPRWGKGGGARK